MKKLALILFIGMSSIPAFASGELLCSSPSKYCLELGGVESSDGSILYATAFATPSSPELIPVENVSIEVRKDDSKVILVSGQSELELGRLGAAQDSNGLVFELALESGSTFETKRLRTGERTLCANSALGATQKFVTPIVEVEVDAAKGAGKISFITVLKTGAQVPSGGFLGGLFCRDGDSWD